MTGSLLEAMLAVQAKAPTLAKDRTVTVKTRKGDEYTYSYTPLDSIVEKIGPLLAENKLVWFAQPSNDADGHPTLKYALAHAPSAESIDGEMRLVIEEENDHLRRQLRGAVEDLRYALRCAEAGESWLGTAQAIRGALRTLGVDPASPGGQ